MSLIALKCAMDAAKKGGIDTSHMTLFTLELTNEHMDFGIYSASLAANSTGCTIYWDVENNPNDKTEYVGNLLEPSHTYTTTGRHVIAISDDIKDLYLVSGAAKTNPYVIRLANVLVGLRTGDKVTSLPSVASSTRPDGIYGASKVATYDLNNVTGVVRPFFGTSQLGNNDACKSVICNFVRTFQSYSFEGARSVEDIYCNSLTDINTAARIGFYGKVVTLHFDSPCSTIRSRSGIFTKTQTNIVYQCSDGRIVWNGTEWEIVQ